MKKQTNKNGTQLRPPTRWHCDLQPISDKKLSCCCDLISYWVRRTRIYWSLSGFWNSRDQHKYILSYSIKLNCAFGAGSLLLMPASFLAVRYVLWLNDIKFPLPKVNRKCRPRNTTVQLWTFNLRHRPWEPQCTELQTDGRTDGQTTRYINLRFTYLLTYLLTVGYHDSRREYCLQKICNCISIFSDVWKDLTPKRNVGN